MNRILLTIVAAAALAGCAKEPIDNPAGGEFTISASRTGADQGANQPEQASAGDSQDGSDVYFEREGDLYGEDAQTRTALDPILGLNVFWSDNDRIGLCKTSGGAIIADTAFDETNADGTSGKAKFTGSNPGAGDFVAYYPHSASAFNGISGKVRFKLPAQTQAANGVADRFGEYAFMYTQPVSIAEDATNVAMNFQHAFSVVEISFTPNLIGATAPLTVYSIELRNPPALLKKSFRTTATLDATGAVTLSGDASSVKLNLGEDGAGIALSTVNTTFRGWMVVGVPEESTDNQIEVVINTSAGAFTFQRAIPAGGFKAGGRYALKPYDSSSEIVFSDAAFKAWCLRQTGWDANSDGKLTVKEVTNVTAIKIQGAVATAGIQVVDGLQSFRVLKTVNLSEASALIKVDVSGCANLTELNCQENSHLASLDLSNTPALQILKCNITAIASLDLSNNPALTTLYCSSTSITALDVSKNPALHTLICDNTGLTSLNLSNNPALTTLYCYFTSITALDVSKNPALQTLYCSGIGITTLDVSKNPALKELVCSRTNITTLDVSKNPALKELDCRRTNITTLDLSKCVNLTRLHADNSSLGGKVDLSKSPNFEFLSIENTSVTELDITGCMQIDPDYFLIGGCPLQKLACSNTNLTMTTLGLSRFKSTLDLLVATNMPSLTGTLDLSGFTKLTRVNCNKTKISSLNISGCTAIKEAYCQDNPSMASLYVTGSTRLHTILCYSSGLTGMLDLRSIDPLIYLQCQNTGVDQILIRTGQSFMGGSNLNGVTPTVVP